jgi:FkbH-like protein
MKYTEILKKNRELGAAMGGSRYRIAVLSNITVNQLKEVMELALREKGVNAEVTIGDYDAIAHNSSEFAADKDLHAALLFWEACNLVDGLPSRIALMSEQELEQLAQRMEGEIELALRNLRSVPLVLVNLFSSSAFESDVLRSGPLKRLCARLNSALERYSTVNQLLVDLDRTLSEVGVRSAVDDRQFQSSRALYSIEFFKAYSQAVAPAFIAAAGRARKVLIMDCDNTLWHGVVGEDGEDGIEMGEATPKGRIYREVQTIVMGLRKSGVLLALCSKNNPAEVDRVIAAHPDMQLKEGDLVAKKVNWQDKVTNLRELASELNLGLDSFVFVDDSSFEIGLVQQGIPELKCVQVPANLSEFPGVMRELKREFFTLARTEEDQRKTEMYQQERLRKDQAAKFESMEDYLASLELKLKISWGRNIPLARAAQMTQKTNQFNLTTRRYTEADLERMLADETYRIGVFSVSDRYGDYGVTGMVILKVDAVANNATIDTFLMSCRVIARNVEYAFFDEIVDMLRRGGISTLTAQYSPTAKNGQVARFYDGLGFKLVSEQELGVRGYRLAISDYQPRRIQYIATLEGQTA